MPRQHIDTPLSDTIAAIDGPIATLRTIAEECRERAAEVRRGDVIREVCGRRVVGSLASVTGGEHG